MAPHQRVRNPRHTQPYQAACHRLPPPPVPQYSLTRVRPVALVFAPRRQENPAEDPLAESEALQSGLTFVEKAIKLDPAHIESYAVKGKLKLLMGDLQGSKDAYLHVHRHLHSYVACCRRPDPRPYRLPRADLCHPAAQLYAQGPCRMIHPRRKTRGSLSAAARGHSEPRQRLTTFGRGAWYRR